MIRAAIIGAAGYTGGELLRLLCLHPALSDIIAVSESHAGKPIHTAHSDLFTLQHKVFVREFDPATTDVIFLCGGHGESQHLLDKHALHPGKHRIIDLSQDFRLTEGQAHFQYGLPEAFRTQIRHSQSIANPGCFATAIQLALLPLAAHQLLSSSIHVTGITGSTGAGQKPQDSSHFAWRAHNVSVYKPFTHQHLAEIQGTLRSLQPSFAEDLLFVPMRGAFPRGILCSLHTRLETPHRSLLELYETYYHASPFVHILPPEIHLKQVINTNHCLLSLEKHGDYLHIVCCLDNLLKGASGQAVQNMNLLFDRPETEGLLLKTLAY